MRACPNPRTDCRTTNGRARGYVCFCRNIGARTNLCAPNGCDNTTYSPR